MKEPTKAQQTRSADDSHGIKTIADIAKLSWVDKRCRLWAADGDIDVDQTCLVVKTRNGGLIVIPNEYNDEELRKSPANCVPKRRTSGFCDFMKLAVEKHQK
jgi:hypothetical protein